MDEIELIDATELPYLYAERTCQRKPEVISEEMGSAFREVWDHMQAAAVRPAGSAIAVYTTVEEDPLIFRSGFVIASEDSSKADEDVRADITPAVTVLHCIHVGPYHKLADSWKGLMAEMENRALTPQMPYWEVYASDPDTTPVEQLRTELFLPVT